MTRKPDWALWLDALVTARLFEPFSWGSNDCALFAADAVQAVTGTDLAQAIRGYRGPRQALRVLADHGGVRAIACAALGNPHEDIIDSRDGDIAMIVSGKREALSLVYGGMAVAPGPDGLHWVPLPNALCAWRVG